MTRLRTLETCRSGGQPPHPRSIFEKSKLISGLFAEMETI